MYSLFWFFLILHVSLFAYSDTDFDGVEDSYDKCPDTLFTELVNEQGCPIHSLVSPHHFDIITGLSYGQHDEYTLQESDALSLSLQADYYYKDFSAQLSLSTYSLEEESGLNDTTLSIFYKFPLLNTLSLRLGSTVILPTYETGLDNEATDYAGSIELIYTFEDNTLFSGFSHTFVNDTDTDDVIYQDVNAFSLGYGHYFSSNFYASIAYYYADSIYLNVVSIQSSSAYMYYAITENIFSTLTYSYGLSDSANDHYAGLRIGYYY
jgi:hypothetical protein